jgi:hypothetical protein
MGSILAQSSSETSQIVSSGLTAFFLRPMVWPPWSGCENQGGRRDQGAIEIVESLHDKPSVG